MGYIKEWQCTCNECGNQWHYLDSVEKKMHDQIQTNACTGLSFCCNPCIGLSATNANTQLENQILDLRRCPKCKSSNVRRTEKYFEA